MKRTYLFLSCLLALLNAQAAQPTKDSLLCEWKCQCLHVNRSTASQGTSCCSTDFSVTKCIVGWLVGSPKLD